MESTNVTWGHKGRQKATWPSSLHSPPYLLWSDVDVNYLYNSRLQCDVLQFQRGNLLYMSGSHSPHKHQVGWVILRFFSGRERKIFWLHWTEDPEWSCSAHLVSSRSDSSCFRCLESNFFSMDRRTQALAFPTSVLISLMFWMCLGVRNSSCQKSLVHEEKDKY